MPAPKKHPPYPGCETGGRPLKYTKEFIEKEADGCNLKGLNQQLRHVKNKDTWNDQFWLN